MEIAVAPERALIHKEQLSMDQAEGRAWNKRIDAFGAVTKLTSFLSKPKDDDFELIYKEFRFQPFWHIVCHSKYVYERKAEYRADTSGPEVKKVTHNGKEYAVANTMISLDVLESCEQEEERQVFIDGISGEEQSGLQDYLKYDASEFSTLENVQSDSQQTIIVPPVARASSIVRDALAKVMHAIEADTMLEETVEVKTIDLHYRPVYGFQYKWISKGKEAIVEIDGLTGQLQIGQKTFKQYLGKVVEKNFLFDIGAETANLIVPGGGIALKFAQKYFDVRGKK